MCSLSHHTEESELSILLIETTISIQKLMKGCKYHYYNVNNGQSPKETHFSIPTALSCREMLVVKIETMNRHNIYRQRYRNCRPCSLQSSSKNVSIFYEREQHICRNHMSQCQQGSWAMVWNSHVSTIYDLTFMLTK